MGYPLGWTVIPQMVVRRERWPGGHRTKGTPLVYPGQEVLPDQPVLHIEGKEARGQVEPVQAAPRLSLPSAPSAAEASSDKMKGESQAKGKREMLPAGLQGRVVDITRRGGVIIESRAAVVQGVMGVGEQVAGILTLWAGGGKKQPAIPPGAILVVPGPVNFAMLRQAVSSGVAGLVASSISLRDFEGFLRTDLLELIDSTNLEQLQSHLPPLTVLLTEGLGDFIMPARVVNLLGHYQGSIALMSGAISLRQGIFPELLISLPLEELQQHWHPLKPDTALVLGAQIRICGGEHAGKIGIIDYLFGQEQLFNSGIHARALRVRLEDGSLLVIPMVLAERIG